MLQFMGVFFHEDWDKLSKEFEEKSSSVVIADVDCTAGGKSKCEEATDDDDLGNRQTFRGILMGIPSKNINLSYLGWKKFRKWSHELCISKAACSSFVPSPNTSRSEVTSLWNGGQNIHWKYMFWQNPAGSFQLMHTKIFLNMFSPGGYPWIPYHQIWRSRWSSGKFCRQKKDVDTEGPSKDAEVCKGNWILMDFGGKSLWHIQSKLPFFFCSFLLKRWWITNSKCELA